MNKRRCHRHHPFDRNHHAAVAFDAEEHAFYAFEDATVDADAIAFGHGNIHRGKVNDLLIVGAGHGNEVAHLGFGDGYGLAGFTVHDVAKWEDGGFRFFYFVQLATGGMDKDQVVNGRNKFTDLALIPYHILVAHRDEILNLDFIQIDFQRQFTAIGNTHCVPEYVVVSWLVHVDEGSE